MNNHETHSNRSTALDGLRGYAALAVVFYHAILHNDLSLIERVLHAPIQQSQDTRDLITKTALSIFNGETAVFLFFVLSGAVLYNSLNRKYLSLPALIVQFSCTRLLRLYPPLIACLVFYFILSHLSISNFPKFTTENLIQNALLTKISMHGPSTTIQAEVLAIPFIITAYLLRRYLNLPGLTLFLTLSILAIEQPLLTLNLPNMHAYLFAFIAGMLASDQKLYPLIQQTPGNYWLIAAATLIASRVFHPQSSLTSLIAMVLSAAILVAGLMHGQKGWFTNHLENSFCQFFGKISYSLYLINVPILYLIWSFTDELSWTKTNPLEAGMIIGTTSIILTIPIALISEKYIERPSIQIGRKISLFIGRTIK